LANIPDATVAKFWQWAFNLTSPLPAFVINTTDDPSYVFLMDPADAHPDSPTSPGTLPMSGHCPNKQIMIPLWVAYCTTSEYPSKNPQQLAVLAREQYNMGHFKSKVTVGNSTVATLDYSIYKKGDRPSYTDNNSSGQTEHTHSSGFPVTIPANSIKQYWGSIPGSFQAATHGFFAVLDPLGNGTHTISYNTKVIDDDATSGRSPGIPYTSKNITYTLTIP
jgi:hypothetical protein